MMETPDVVPRPDTPALVHESYDFIPGSGEDPTWDWVNMPTMQQFVVKRSKVHHGEIV